MNNHFLILAPHLKYPPRNGADLYVERIGRYLSLFREQVTIIGADTITSYQAGELLSQQAYQNDFRAKKWAAIRTLIFNTHYFFEKFLTNGYRQKVSEYLRENPETFLIDSFITTASLHSNGRQAVILTHNDEILWFQDQSRFSGNPLHKLTARISGNWVRKFLREHANDYLYVHNTITDAEGYGQWIPTHESFIVAPGVELQQPPTYTPWDGTIRLLFIGALGIKTNYDALVFFKNNFWPLLKMEFKQNIEMTVLGSQPSVAVRQICQQEKWQLLPDATDEELRAQYGRATFSVLPFQYSTGAKHKLLNSMAAGLPVLATTNMNTIPGQEFSPNLYSDEPQQWLNHLRNFTANGVLISDRLACRQFASLFTWKQIVADMDEKLREYEI